MASCTFIISGHTATCVFIIIVFSRILSRDLRRMNRLALVETTSSGEYSGQARGHEKEVGIRKVFGAPLASRTLVTVQSSLSELPLTAP